MNSSILWLFCNILENSKNILFKDFFKLNILKKVFNIIDLSKPNEISLNLPLRLLHIILKNLGKEQTLNILGEENILAILSLLNKCNQKIENEENKIHYLCITLYLVSIDNDKIKIHIMKYKSRILDNIMNEEWDLDKYYFCNVIKIFWIITT